MDSFINNEQLELSIKKVRMYKQALDVDLEEIEKNMRELLYFFDTKNKKSFETLNLEIRNKNRVVNRLNDGYLVVLEKTLSHYNETALTVAKSFEEIGK